MIISEQEKNRIRKLHEKKSILSEQDKKWWQFWKKNTGTEEETEPIADLTTIETQDSLSALWNNLPSCSEFSQYEGWEVVKGDDFRAPRPGDPSISNIYDITFSWHSRPGPEGIGHDWVLALRNNKPFCKVGSM